MTMSGLGSRDGQGAGDHDQPYNFGRRPRAAAPFPFTTQQYARLLALRGRVADGLIGQDDLASAPRLTYRYAAPSEDGGLLA
jgi:hypothetical protein